MRNRRKMNMKRVLFALIIFFIFLIIILSSILFVLDSKEQKDDETIKIAMENNYDPEKIEENVKKDKLSKMEEYDRMKHYFSSFLDAVETGKYDKAYDMLYDEFRNNYFQDLETFEKYAKKTFSKMVSIKHTNFERNGDVYILWIELSDPLSSTKDSAKEMNIVIQEYDLNDFVMSFSIK